MISQLGPTASAIVWVIGLLATWGLLAQGIAAARAVRIAKATGLDPTPAAVKAREAATRPGCRCDGFAVSQGGPFDPDCPVHRGPLGRPYDRSEIAP